MFGDTDLPLALIMEEILSAGRRSPVKRMKKRKKAHNFHQLPKSLEHKKRSRREDFTSSSDFLI